MLLMSKSCGVVHLVLSKCQVLRKDLFYYSLFYYTVRRLVFRTYVLKHLSISCNRLVKCTSKLLMSSDSFVKKLLESSY